MIEWIEIKRKDIPAVVEFIENNIPRRPRWANFIAETQFLYRWLSGEAQKRFEGRSPAANLFLFFDDRDDFTLMKIFYPNAKTGEK